MAIFNTPRLTTADVAGMNNDFRSLGLAVNGGLITDAEINETQIGPLPLHGLAWLFDVKPATVRSWLVPVSTSSRNLIRATQLPNATVQIGAVGRRVYCLSPQRDGYLPAMRALRMRIFLAACLGNNDPQDNGLERVPVYNGNSRELPRRVWPRLSSALEYINGIWMGDMATNMSNGIDGTSTFFLERAWTKFQIVAVKDRTGTNVVGWMVLVNYNDYTTAEGSDPDVDMFDGEDGPPCP